METINGFTVVADKPANTAGDFRSILAVREINGTREYVIAWAENRCAGEAVTHWSSGHYVWGDFPRAVEIFTNH